MTLKNLHNAVARNIQARVEPEEHKTNILQAFDRVKKLAASARPLIALLNRSLAVPAHIPDARRLEVLETATHIELVQNDYPVGGYDKNILFSAELQQGDGMFDISRLVTSNRIAMFAQATNFEYYPAEPKMFEKAEELRLVGKFFDALLALVEKTTPQDRLEQASYYDRVLSSLQEIEFYPEPLHDRLGKIIADRRADLNREAKDALIEKLGAHKPALVKVADEIADPIKDELEAIKAQLADYKVNFDYSIRQNFQIAEDASISSKGQKAEAEANEMEASIDVDIKLNAESRETVSYAYKGSIEGFDEVSAKKAQNSLCKKIEKEIDRQFESAYPTAKCARAKTGQEIGAPSGP